MKMHVKVHMASCSLEKENVVQPGKWTENDMHDNSTPTGCGVI